jgi:hypothetical protein
MMEEESISSFGFTFLVAQVCVVGKLIVLD